MTCPSRLVSVVYDGPPAGGPCCIDLWFYALGVGNTPITADNKSDHTPAVAPDGEHLAWGRGAAIWTMTEEGTNITRVRGGNAYTPQYSPDGRRIIYGDGEIYTVKPNGKDQKRLNGRHRFVDGSPVYSPDGRLHPVRAQAPPRRVGPARDLHGQRKRLERAHARSQWRPELGPALVRALLAGGSVPVDR